MAERMGSAVGSASPHPERSRPGLPVVTLADGSCIALHVFPEDARLVDDVDRIVTATEAGTLTDAEAFRVELERQLRAWYPRVTIHSRDDIAALMPTDRVWYVMRDGRVRQRDDRIERLHAALATARDVTAEADAAIGRSRTVHSAVTSGRPLRRNGRSEAANGATTMIDEAITMDDDDAD